MHQRRIDLFDSDFPSIFRSLPTTLQINLGYRCNQSCVHCHVNASPYRTEEMNSQTVDQVIDVIERLPIACVDLTGGAPELHPQFRTIVKAARETGITVIDRCNLTVLLEPEQQDTAEFLADLKVQVVASLPCYLQENVERQRGKGIFKKSIEALQILNGFGYGHSSDLELNLIFNPQGATLPPPQVELEQQYKKELRERYGVVFNRLFTITNMPINRFGAVLKAHGEFESYLRLLKNNHLDENLATVMCQQTVSVDWRGILYDCDFNQMLDMPIEIDGNPASIQNLREGTSLVGRRIKTANHCYGCTAGQGSSCGGALST